AEVVAMMSRVTGSSPRSPIANESDAGERGSFCVRGAGGFRGKVVTVSSNRRRGAIHFQRSARAAPLTAMVSGFWRKAMMAHLRTLSRRKRECRATTLRAIERDGLKGAHYVRVTKRMSGVLTRLHVGERLELDQHELEHRTIDGCGRELEFDRNSKA